MVEVTVWYGLVDQWMSQVVARFVVRSQGRSRRVVSLMMWMVMGLVVAVECRAPVFSQRQSRLRKADELTLPFRLAAPVHCAGAPWRPTNVDGLRNAVNLVTRHAQSFSPDPTEIRSQHSKCLLA